MSDPSARSKKVTEILAVEDSPTQAEHLRYLLEEGGYTVTVASNGLLALDAARRRKPSLIISDIVMPQMDGYQLCREIKFDPQLKDIPVVLITSLSSPQDVIKGLECGADSFIRKPYDEKYLLSRIEYLRANQALRQKEQTQMGLEIYLGGQRHFITAERQQIFDLLVSTYEEAVRLNEGLNRSNEWLHGLYRIAEGLNQAQNEREVCEITLAAAMELPGVRTGWIFLREGESDARLAALSGLPPVLGSPRALEGDCHCRRLLLGGEFTQATPILECEQLLKAGGSEYAPRYHASIPLWSGNRVFGVMNLIGEEQSLFSDEDLAILNGVGNQIGIALERAHLRAHLEDMVAERTAALEAEIVERKLAEEEAQRRLELLHSLHAIDKAIIAVSDISTTLDTILQQTAAQLKVDAVDVMLFDRQTKELFYAAGTGFAYEITWQTRWQLGEGYVGRVASERRPAFVPDLKEVDFARSALVQEEGFVGYYAVPLLVQDELRGVLEVFHRAKFDPKPEWLESLQSLALQTAIAINHADLFAQTRHLLRRTQEQARQLEQIMDTVPEGVVFLDGDYTIRIANEIAETYLALLADVKVGEALTQLDGHAIAEIIDDPRSEDWQELAVRNGQHVFELTVRPMRRNSRAAGWVLVLREVTEDRQRRQHMQVQDRLATVGQLAAGIAHDFNNLLTPILLYTEMNVSDAPQGSSMRDNLEQVLIAASRARDLIYQILAFSRQGAVQERKPIQLRPYIREVLKLMQAVLPSTITVREVIADETGSVLANPIQIQQILMNLCTNAYHAMRQQGGTLTVSLDTYVADADFVARRTHLRAGPYVRVTVGDTGHGMTPSTMEHIFDPFFTTKAAGEGTGMGLSVVYGIVMGYDGDITVDSTPGRGSTFQIHLPQISDVAESEATAPTPLSGSNKHILLVDDEEPIVRVTKVVLQSLGYTVTDHINSVAALADFRERPEQFDLVITDLTMPRMTGIALAQALHDIRPDLPILLVSGAHEMLQSETAETAGVRDTLMKPFLMSDLAKKAHRLLSADVGKE